jgi:hypothetical protein
MRQFRVFALSSFRDCFNHENTKVRKRETRFSSPGISLEHVTIPTAKAPRKTKIRHEFLLGVLAVHAYGRFAVANLAVYCFCYGFLGNITLWTEP